MPSPFKPRVLTEADAKRLLEKGPIRGYVPTVSYKGRDLRERELTLVPQGQASKVVGQRRWNPRAMAPEPVPEQLIRQLKDVPAMPRREARERFKVLVQKLVQDALPSYRRLGYPVWPSSVQAELTALGWKQGDPKLWEQVESLARYYIERGARMQKEQDDRQTSIGWHGHLSA